MDVVMKTLVFAFLFTFVVERSSAIECYTCTSTSISDSDNCANPDGTTSKETCTGECQTILTYFSDSITAVTRSCTPLCVETSPVLGAGPDTECCSTDNCNSDSATSQVDPCIDVNLWNCMEKAEGAMECPGNGDGDGDGDGDGGDVCYFCSWPGDDSCKSPDDTTPTCSGSTCLKTTVHNGDDLTSVTRACNAACSTSDIDFFGVKTETACCEGDKCNNAVYSVVSFVALFMSFIAAIYHTAL